jgi:hypothetical protein
MRNYPGQTLGEKKEDKAFETALCVMNMYVDKYDNWDEYFNELPNDNSQALEDLNKMKLLMTNLLKCDIELSGTGYIQYEMKGIEGFDVNHMPEYLKKELRKDVKNMR